MLSIDRVSTAIFGMHNTEDLKAHHNIIITPGNAQFPIKENIEVCGIETWIGERLPELIEKYF